MASLHPGVFESFCRGWPIRRADGLDDLERFLLEPGFRSSFRFPGGQFVLCQRDDRRGCAVALRDPTATMPLHAHFDGRHWLISTSVRKIEEQANKRFDLDFEVLKGIHATMRLLPNSSIYRGILLLQPGAVYFFKKDGSFSTYKIPPDWADTEWSQLSSIEDDFWDAAIQLVERSVTESIVAGRTILQQSGGLDSNLILQTARRASIPIRAHGMVFPDLACDESEIMKLSCAKASVDFSPVDYAGRNYQDWKDRMFERSEYPPFTTTFMSLSLGQQAAESGFDVCLNGMGGDEVFYFDRRRSAAFLSRFLGMSSLGLLKTGESWVQIKGFLRGLLSGKVNSLAHYLVSGGWQFQMAATQMLMDDGVQLRLPFRDWRLIVTLLPMVAGYQARKGTATREFQRVLLTKIAPDLKEFSNRKATFEQIGTADGAADDRFGVAGSPVFKSLIPDFVRYAEKHGRAVR